MFCRSPLKVGGFCPWRGSLSHLIGFGFCGSCDAGPRGGGEGGDPPVGIGIRFRTDAIVVPNWFRIGSAQVSVLLTKGNDPCCAIGCGAGLNSGSVVSCGESEARLAVIAARAPAISLLRRCSSLVVGRDVRLLGGFSCCQSMSSVISGMGGQKLSTFCCTLVAMASSGISRCFPLLFWLDGVFREF